MPRLLHSPRACLITGSLLCSAATLLLLDRPSEPREAAEVVEEVMPQPRVSVRREDELHPIQRSVPADLVGMGRSELESAFDTLDTPAADRTTVLNLSEELRLAIRNGLPPDSSEAVVYGEAMLTILAFGTDEPGGELRGSR